MKHILVVFTGGTIGSLAVNGTINTNGQAAYQLISLYKQHNNEKYEIDFTCISPLQVLSENLAPEAWEVLIAAIEAAKPTLYDGIIVTHGTDTLAFTAAALSLYFNAIAIPVLLVSSDYPLAHANANGLENFICAVEFICQNKAHGVFVPYTNRKQGMQIHHGARLASSLQLSGDFISVQNQPYCTYEKGQFSEASAIAKRNPVNLSATFSQRILLIKPYPGLEYNYFNLDAVDIVLHDLYHSGTACSSLQWGQQYALTDFIQQCQKRDIKVYLAPALKSDSAYESTRTLLEAGAEMLWNMSLEATYAKLLLAYGNFAEVGQRQAFLCQDISGEMVV
ncbi:MAG: asparaginase domain-containing protein [Methylococcaceae bacterium]|jgi:L-asparaginase